MSFTTGPRAFSSASQGDSSYSHSALSSRHASVNYGPSHSVATSATEHRPIYPSHLNPAIAKLGPTTVLEDDERDEISPSKGLQALPASPFTGAKSGLSMMLERDKEDRRVKGLTEAVSLNSKDSIGSFGKPPSDEEGLGERTPMPRRSSLVDDILQLPTTDGNARIPHAGSSSSLRRHLANEVNEEELGQAPDERSLLLGNGRERKKRSWAGQMLSNVGSWKNNLSKVTARDVAEGIILEPIRTLPSVILGLLLNVLDGVSYGMILFPATPIFTDFGSLGVSMFFVSCIVSQLVFSLGGSIFPGGNGSMMIEAVPFFHILINTFEQVCGDDSKAVIATTMVAFAFSSILTGEYGPFSINCC